MPTITLTFSECVENHAGMQKIGDIKDKGFSVEELKSMKASFEEKGVKTEYHDLTGILPENKELDEAGVLVIRGGVNCILGDSKYTVDDLHKEHKSLEYDKKAFMRGRVVNKHARYNLCFADFDQEPEYSSGKGRVIAFDKLPVTKCMREKIPSFCGNGSKDLFTESNYYYDNQKCGIGWHGDTERRLVIGLRMGDSMNLMYNWFHRFKPVGEKISITLNHGDLYVMSSKAVGFDWKKSSKYTLRHSAGCAKYTKL